jgi:lysophospholipase L1-like esterase
LDLQFGHNDQKEAANISLSQFQTNLENFAKEVKAAGGTPVRSTLPAFALIPTHY